MYRHRTLLTALVLTCTFVSQSQSSLPLDDGQTIKLLFTEKGVLKQAPEGFVLKESKKYKFDVTVEKPQQQRKDLWEFISKKCKNTLERFKDRGDPLSDQYVTFYGSSQKDVLVKQLQELKDILDDKADPHSAFTRSTNDFSFFLGRTFLEENLFGKIFIVYNSFTKSATAEPTDRDYVLLTQTITARADSFEVEIRVAEFTKQFLRNYYLKARSLQATLFDPIHPKVFYNEGEILELLYPSLDSLYNVVRKLDPTSSLICNDTIVERFKQLSNAFINNELLKIIKSDWLSYWLWYTEGDWMINPVGFTDESLLPLQQGFDAGKAKAYDEFIASAIALMRTAPDLSETRADYQRMDSLLQQVGKGRERFSYTNHNEALKTANRDVAKKKQVIDQTIHRVIFKCRASGKNYYLRSYDANANLKGNLGDKNIPFSNDVEVDAMVYNLSSSQEIELKETPVDIKDQSKVITQLNEIGDVAATAFENAGKANAIFPGLLSLFSGPAPTFQPLVIPPPGPGLSIQSITIHERDMKKSTKNYRIKFKRENGFRVTIDADGSVLETSDDMISELNKYLMIMGLDQCAFFKAEVTREVTDYLSRIDINVASLADPKSIIDQHVARIQKELAAIVEKIFKRYEDRSLKVVWDRLAIMNATALLFGNRDSHILPPKNFKAEGSSGPLFRNVYKSFAKEVTAKRKDFELVVTDTKTKAEIKRKDSYKTAPAHWIRGSLGIGYVFESFRRSDAAVSNGAITVTPDEDQVRLIMGLHFYPYPILLADDRNIFNMKGWKQVRTRLSLFAGVSYPKPLYNLHAGVSVDIWTGVQVTGGAHFYRYTSYKVINNQLVDQSSKYVSNGGFVSLTIEPVTFAKLIGLLK